MGNILNERPVRKITLRGNCIELKNPVIMGILNISPDSFYSGSSFITEKSQMEHVAKMLDQGAFVIDIGAVSTRPGTEPPSTSDEIKLLKPLLKKLIKEFQCTYFSIDTYRHEVAEFAAAEGIAMINDISGGTMDPAMYSTIASLRLPYILMHIKGTPADMQVNPAYQNVTSDVIYWLSERVNQLKTLGLPDILIDPGFGFGKTIEHNFSLLGCLESFQFFELPIVVGISRKSMIYKTLSSNPDNALNGTSVLNTIAILKGADILRVHDVHEAMEVIKLTSMLR